MSLQDYVKTSLMPLSQAYGWYMLTNATSDADIYSLTMQLSAFYGGWALLKVYVGGDKREKGHISMGITFLSSLRQHYLATMIASGLVIANYGLPAAMVLPMSDAKLASVVGKGDFKDKPVPPFIKIWVLTFKTYFLSSIALWGVVMYKLTQFS